MFGKNSIQHKNTTQTELNLYIRFVIQQFIHVYIEINYVYCMLVLTFRDDNCGMHLVLTVTEGR